MSERDNFLERWSKRKLAGGDAVPPQGDERPAGAEDKNEATAPPAQDAVACGEEKPFDITSLPPIESIDANTDIKGFLRPGVPPELSRAALRRAWSADPAIRDFVGLVENGWDFNDPQAMPGFGPITPSEVARLAAQILDDLPQIKAKPFAETAKNLALEGSDRQGAVVQPETDSPEAEQIASHEREAPGSASDVAPQNKSNS
jgi:hypothetical protein